MSAEVKSWFGPAAASIVANAGLGALLTKWLQIRSEREPTLADFWNGADERTLDHAVLFLKGEGDYTYLHHGRYLRERVGFSMQGRRLSELRTRVRKELAAVYDRCTAAFEIGYVQTFADFAQDSVLWGRLCLPLRLHADDSRVLLLTICHMIEDKASVFRKIYENSRNPVIVASPIFDVARRVDDAWIISQNEPAAAITGVQDHAHDDLTLRSGPVFCEGALWSAFAQGLASGLASMRIKLSATGESFVLFGELVGGYMIIQLFAETESPPLIQIG